MKERIISPNTLTNQSQKRYSEGKVKIMADGPNNPEGQQPRKLPENNQGNSRNPGEQQSKRAQSSGDEFVHAREIEEFFKKYPGKKWADFGDDQKRMLLDSFELRGEQIKNSREMDSEKNTPNADNDPSSHVLGKELEGLDASVFPEIQQYLQKISGRSVKAREDVEDLYRSFGAASNEDLMRIYDEHHQEEAALIKEYFEKRPDGELECDVWQNELDLKRDNLRMKYSKKREGLRDVHRKFVNALDARYGSSKRSLTADQQTFLNSIAMLENSLKMSITEEQRIDIKKELTERVVALSDTVAPQDEPLPDEILIALGKDAFAAEKFLDRVIRLKQEDAQYHLPGFYSDINVNKFLRLNESRMKEGEMEHVENLLRGTETLHEMNRILKTSLDQFAQISQMILPEHLTTIFKLPGVESVFQLYEGIIKENLSVETMITEEVFNKIDEQVEKEFKVGLGRKILVGRREGGEYLTKSFKGEGQLEGWEAERAITYGRNLMRTLLREGEYISFSHIPEAQRAYISLAQGQLLGVLNPVTYTLKRFKPGESQGGIELLEEVLHKAAEKRRNGRNKESSRGVVRLRELQGTSVEDREATKIINARGAIMTWRATEAILKEFAVVDNGKASNVTKFFEDHKREIGALKEISSNNAWEAEFKRMKGTVRDDNEKTSKFYDNLEDWKRARVYQVFGSLLENSSVGQGILVSSVPLTIPTEVKEMLWERIVQQNPDVIASLLTRVEVDEKFLKTEDIKDLKSLEEIILPYFGTEAQKKMLLNSDDSWRPRQLKLELEKLSNEVIAKLEVRLQNAVAAKDQKEQDKLRAELAEVAPDYDVKRRDLDILNNEVKNLLRNEEWESLRRKLRTINRLRMQDETERMEQIKKLQKEGGEMISISVPRKFSDYLEDKRLVDEDRLSDNERNVVKEISKNGIKITKDLANIQQANIWFLDDVPTNNIRWENLGQSFNRMIGDFGHFSQSANDLNAFLYNPFKMESKEVMEHLAKAITSAGQVLGIESAQDNMHDIVMTYNHWIETYPKYRQKIINMYMTAREKYTSKAQEVARDTSAPSLDEENAYINLLEQNHKSIIRKEKRDKNGKITQTGQFEKAVKDLKLGVARRFLWASLRDYGPFFLLGFFLSLFKETTSEKK